MGKGVEGRREMDLVPHFKLGGSGKGRLLPKGPWLMVLIPNSIWGISTTSWGMVASGDCQGKMYSLNHRSPFHIVLLSFCCPPLPQFLLNFICAGPEREFSSLIPKLSDLMGWGK